MTNSKRSVLIVEDDIMISQTIKELLEDNDFQVRTAPNGLEALKILKDFPIPSVILLDLMMPIMDGFQFRQNQLATPSIKDIPVIVMSADGHVEEKKIQTSAHEYLKKPLDIFKLLKTIDKFSA